MFLFWLFCFCRLSEFIQTWNNTEKIFLDLFIIFYSAVPKLRKFFFLYSYIKYSSRASRRMSNTFDNSHQFTSILFHFHPFLRIHMSNAQTLKWEHFFSFIFIYIFFLLFCVERRRKCRMWENKCATPNMASLYTESTYRKQDVCEGLLLDFNVVTSHRRISD